MIYLNLEIRFVPDYSSSDYILKTKKPAEAGAHHPSTGRKLKCPGGRAF
jgi:hypothetical protein